MAGRRKSYQVEQATELVVVMGLTTVQGQLVMVMVSDWNDCQCDPLCLQTEKHENEGMKIVGLKISRGMAIKDLWRL